MKTKMKTILIISGLVLAQLTFVGCSSGLPRGQGQPEIQVHACPETVIINPELVLADGQAWVHGTVKQNSYNAGPLLAHVDIRVYSAQGKELSASTSENIVIPKNTIGRNTDKVNFKAKLPKLPEAGSSLTLTIHDSCEISNCPYNDILARR